MLGQARGLPNFSPGGVFHQMPLSSEGTRHVSLDFQLLLDRIVVSRFDS